MDLSTYRLLSSGGIMTLISLALIGNSLVCLAVYFSRNLRARVNYLILSLAVSDILIASLAMPIWLMYELTHFRNLSHDATLKVSQFGNFVDMLGGITSIANLVAISFERLWSVWYPLNHRRNMTNKTAVFIILSVWIYGILVTASTISMSNWKWFPIYCAVMGFFLPLLLIIGAYIIIGVIVNKSPRNVISLQDNIRINIAIIIIVVLFVVCWAPYFTALLLSHYCELFFDYIIDHLWLRSFLKFLHYSNSCVNPVVYVIANAQYKEGFKIVLKKIFKRCLNGKSNNSPKINRRIFVNNKRPKSDVEKLCARLTPEDKESEFPPRVFDYRTDSEKYLPGDYRALPAYNLKTDNLDDPEVFKEIQLSLTRTSYI